MKKRNLYTLKLSLWLVGLIWACFYTAGCSPAEAAAQTAPTPPAAMAAETKEIPAPNPTIDAFPVPIYAMEPEQIEKLIAAIYEQANRIAQQDRPGADEMIKAGEWAEKALKEYRNSLSPEEYQVYWDRRDQP